MFGFFNVNKPPGQTSHDVVDQVRRRAGGSVKVGHAGTLDPFAEGVLVLCAGPATRLAQYVQAHRKRYVARITLGATSTTDDPEGDVQAVAGAVAPSLQAVGDALGGFVGEIQQVPPAHSAVHVAGRRAYRLARAGKRPNMPARTVAIHSLEMLGLEYPILDIDVTCASGTYIRALARDIGAALGCGGYCSALKRTQVGPFNLQSARSIDELDLRRDLLSPLTALESIRKMTLGTDHIRALTLGQSIPLEIPGDASEVAVLDEQGRLIAMAVPSADGSRLKPSKVFAPRT